MCLQVVSDLKHQLRQEKDSKNMVESHSTIILCIIYNTHFICTDKICILSMGYQATI